MIQSIKRAVIVLASLAAGYACFGVPEAHSTPLAAEQSLVSQAPEELTDKVCTATGCAAACSPGSCHSFRQNSTGGCTYTCVAPIEKSPAQVK